MTTQQQNAAVATINKIIASNNPTTAVSVLKQNGFQTQFDVLPADQIESALNNLYNSNRATYLNVVKQIPYREDITNWTTSPDTKTSIRNIANQMGLTQPAKPGMFYGINFGNLWNQIIGGIGGTATQNPNVSTTTTQPAYSATVIIILTVLGLALLTFVLWKTGVFKKATA